MEPILNDSVSSFSNSFLCRIVAHCAAPRGGLILTETKLPDETRRTLFLCARVCKALGRAVESLLLIPEELLEDNELVPSPSGAIRMWYTNLSLLGFLAGPCIRTIVGRFNSPSTFARWEAVRTLGWLAPNINRSSVEELLRLLRYEDSITVIEEGFATLTTILSTQRKLVAKWSTERENAQRELLQTFRRERVQTLVALECPSSIHPPRAVCCDCGEIQGIEKDCDCDIDLPVQDCECWLGRPGESEVDSLQEMVKEVASGLTWQGANRWAHRWIDRPQEVLESRSAYSELSAPRCHAVRAK